MAEINFSKQALNDIDEIALYWARFSEKTAKTYIQKIYATIELLAQFPHLGICLQNLTILPSGKSMLVLTGFLPHWH